MDASCPSSDELLLWARGKAPSAAARLSWEAHLATCRDCQAKLQVLQAKLSGGAVTRNLRRAETPQPVPDARAFAEGGEVTQTGKAPASQLPSMDRLSTGDTIGRYVVVEKLGQGGMGVVYTAFDPELDRRVAVKLLQDEGTARAQELQKEAQAMAKLAHPNVVAVYDVGTAPGHGVFVAMELVVGENLRTYLQKHPGLSVKDKLGLLVGAGEGLNEAHEQGLIHRDFKPDNVLVDLAGRVRVMDFGLARLSSTATASHPVETPAAAAQTASWPQDPLKSSRSLLSQAPRTEAGRVHGTRGYIAPEQWKGEPATPAADQFAFCVSLYEALYGVRPFGPVAGSRPAGGWGVAEPPRGARVPLWLRKVVLQGLAEAPGDRFPNMRELLRALGRDPTVTRRALLASALAVLLIVAGGAAVQQRMDARSRVCQGAAKLLEHVWDGGRRQRLHDAFGRQPSEVLQSAWLNTQAGLERFTRGWVAMRTQACEATRIQGEQTERVMGLRMECLDLRLHELDALAGILEQGDEATLLKAPEAVSSLTPLGNCADLVALQSAIPLPSSPQDRALYEQGKRALVEAKTMFSTGREEAALRVSQQVLETAQARRLEALTAQALYESGRAQGTHMTAASESALWRAVIASLATHQDSLALEAANRLTQAYINSQNKREASRILDLSGALVARLPATGLATAQRTCFLAVFEKQQGNFEGAVALGKSCLGAAGALPAGNEIDVATLYAAGGTALSVRGHYGEALAADRRALDLRQGVTGDYNPLTALYLSNVANAAMLTGQWGDAVLSAERAVELLRRLPSAGSLLVATSTLNLGEAYFGNDQLAFSEEAFRSALRLAEAVDHDPSLHVMLLNDLALVLLARGGSPTAASTAAMSLALAERSLQPQDDERRMAVLTNAWLSAVNHPALAVRSEKSLRALASDLDRHPMENSDLASGLLALALAEVIAQARPHAPEVEQLASQARAAFTHQKHRPLLELVDAGLRK